MKEQRKDMIVWCVMIATILVLLIFFLTNVYYMVVGKAENVILRTPSPTLLAIAGIVGWIGWLIGWAIRKAWFRHFSKHRTQ